MNAERAKRKVVWLGGPSDGDELYVMSSTPAINYADHDYPETRCVRRVPLVRMVLPSGAIREVALWAAGEVIAVPPEQQR